jgi:amino acid transporter
VSEAAAEGESTVAERSGLFTRTATGLVRGVPPRSSLIINFIPGHPTQTMVAVLLFALAVGPGGNPFLAVLLVVPMSLAFAYAFGLLTQMIPRSGGDYMLVSRVTHPAVGYVSVFCMTTAGLLSNAFFGLAVVTAGVTPLCVSVGLIGGWPGLVSWGQGAATSKGWLIFFGLAMFAFAGIMQLWGWRWILRLQNVFFWMVTASLTIVTVVTLFQSKSHFISKFNGFAQGITHKPDAYHSTISTAAKAGVAVSPSFSFSATIPIIAVFATTAIFSYWSTFVGGELRQASTIKTANNMALGGVIPLIVVAICTAVFFKTFGSDFLRAANGGGLPSDIATPGTTFFYLSGISVGSTLYTIVIFGLYIVFWPLITYISSLQQTRAIFAMSFDGALPKGVTRVNRYGCPDLALLFALLASAAVFIWAVYDQTGFFIVLAYALLVQLIAMGIVGLAAVLAPITRPELYRASTSQKSLAGIPLVQIAGAGAILTAVFVWWAYLHYDQLGANADMTKLLGWTIGPAILGGVFYFVVAAVKRSRGTDITLVYREIPPE